MEDDAQLLRRYVDDRAEDAFAELVRRHIGLVYACALRRVGFDAHLAEDVTQKVFADLARKAASLTNRPTLAGWLYVGARQAAAEAVRGERRRKTREEQAMTMESIRRPADPGADIDWTRLRPVLDDLVAELKEADRDAVVMRFFESRSFAEIGAALSQTEDGARKRVERAVEKLRTRLAERGVTSGSAALALALAQQAGAAVPASLAGHVTGAALAEATAAGVGASLLATLWSALTSQVTAISAALAIGAGLVTWQYRANAEIAGRIDQIATVSPTDLQILANQNQRLAQQAAEVDQLRRLHAMALANTRNLKAPPRPVAEESKSDAPPRVVANVTLTEKGTIRWEGEPVTLDEYLKRLQALKAQPGVTPQVQVHSTGRENPGALSYVMEQASKAEIADLALKAENPPALSNDWITSVPPAPPGPHETAPPEIRDPVKPAKP